MDELTNENSIASKTATRRITRTLGLTLAACAALSVSPVNADTRYTPVLEYNEMLLEEKLIVVRAALSQIYEHYSVREPNIAIADCIIDLFNNPDREINGYDHLGVAVQVALTSPDVEVISIERILLGIVNRQCIEMSD